MLGKKRSTNEYSFDESRSQIIKEFKQFVLAHKGEPEFEDAMYRCAHKWRSEIGHVGLRYRIVDFAAHGVSLAEIAKHLEVDVKTVKAWLVRFMESGINGLKDKPRSGRPPKSDQPCKVKKTTKSTKATKSKK